MHGETLVRIGLLCVVCCCSQWEIRYILAEVNVQAQEEGTEEELVSLCMSGGVGGCGGAASV